MSMEDVRLFAKAASDKDVREAVALFCARDRALQAADPKEVIDQRPFAMKTTEYHITPVVSRKDPAYALALSVLHNTC